MQTASNATGVTPARPSLEGMSQIGLHGSGPLKPKNNIMITQATGPATHDNSDDLLSKLKKPFQPPRRNS